MMTDDYNITMLSDESLDPNLSYLTISASVIIERIERTISEIILTLEKGDLSLGALQVGAAGATVKKTQFPTFTNMLLVMCYVHNLLLSKRTSTTREVFYFYVTHFKTQRECDKAISDVSRWLEVPRLALGLVASPKGWISGCVKLIHDGRITDCTSLSSMHGFSITREWLDMVTWEDHHLFSIESDAECIIVVEKEAIYTRLTEDRFFDHEKCIIITGKGFPDIATRACVYALYQNLQIPIYGLCDCNPFGISVLMTYWKGSDKLGVESDRYSVPIQWLGIRPSQIEALQDELPNEVFQTLSDLDRSRLMNLSRETCPFIYDIDDRLYEINKMIENGWKVELESLQWFGLEFISQWLASKIHESDAV